MLIEDNNSFWNDREASLETVPMTRGGKERDSQVNTSKFNSPEIIRGSQSMFHFN